MKGQDAKHSGGGCAPMGVQAAALMLCESTETVDTGGAGKKGYSGREAMPMGNAHGWRQPRAKRDALTSFVRMHRQR